MVQYAGFIGTKKELKCFQSQQKPLFKETNGRTLQVELNILCASEGTVRRHCLQNIYFSGIELYVEDKSRQTKI